MSDASIQLHKAGLVLPIYGTINRSLKGAMMASATGGRMAAASRHVTIVEALKDSSLDIRAGDRVGLTGHNGAGKTSLLRMMAGIYEPTSGSIAVQGRVSSFINLGMGMDLEATGRENLMLCGLMFGMRAEEIRRSAPAMAEFSGRGGFIGMTEAIRQLTDAAPGWAVPGAQLGLVSGFGMVTYDRCLCTGAVILGRST